MKMHAAGSVLTDASAGQTVPGTKWLLNLVRLAALGVIHWQQQRRNIGELQRLDDRLLADIGISRSEIEEGVRLGRWGMHATGLNTLSTVVE